MAFSLTSVALACHVAEAEGPLEGSLATILIIDFLAVFAGVHSRMTPLQNLLLVLPLSTALALTIVVFKVTLRKSNKKSLQHDPNHSHMSSKLERKFCFEC